MIYLAVVSTFIYHLTLLRTALSSKCSQSELSEMSELCSKYVKATTDEEMTFPSSQDSLDRSCRNITKGLKCFDELAKSCFKGKQLMEYQEIYGGPTKAYTKFCTDKELQKNLLLHAQCYRKLSVDDKLCRMQFKEMTKSSADPSDNYHLKHTCCSVHLYTECMTRHVTLQCNVRAANFLPDYINISGPFKERYCKGITTDRCSSASTLHNGQLALIITLSSLMTASSLIH